ncbi:hypothetical protein [Streptomyces sp. NRRL F-2580]|uniref:hypothetical protein n=1 Tax=Streptomyces sp. NRRL F-2580 TaxID=1463841 RepID=UPI0004CAF5A0|nr:hypothetical protein [Streptomyces sp. NRRL F-2580]
MVQQLVLDRGGELTTVAALSPEGDVGASTELVLPDPCGTRTLQYDTVVTPATAAGAWPRREAAHGGPGRRPVPGAAPHATTVADENVPMRMVNESLGYRRARYGVLPAQAVAAPL